MRDDAYAARRINLDPPRADPNAALREIAGRIKKLPYRDLKAPAHALREAGPSDYAFDLEGRILAAADKLETA